MTFNPLLRVIGIGNAFRTDDAAGLLAVRWLQKRHLPGVEFAEHSGEGAHLLELLKGSPAVFLIDAVQSSAPPGTLVRLNLHEQIGWADVVPVSSHSFGLQEAVQLAKQFGWLPDVARFYGICAGSVRFGEKPSPKVQEAVPVLVDEICHDAKLLLQSFRQWESCSGGVSQASLRENR